MPDNDILVPAIKANIKETLDQLKKATLPRAMLLLKTSFDNIRIGVQNKNPGAWLSAITNAAQAGILAAAAWKKNPDLAARIIRTAKKFIIFAKLETDEISPPGALDAFGIINMPDVSIPVWSGHIKGDIQHLRRWTRREPPERPKEVFRKSLEMMEKLRLLEPHEGQQFVVEAKTKQGPVWIVGSVVEGELLPKTVLPVGSFINPKEGALVDLTEMIKDPKHWWEGATV